MMRKIVVVLMAAILAVAIPLTSAVAGAPPEEEWSRTFGDVSIDRCYYVQQTSDGGYIVAGSMKFSPLRIFR